MICFCNISHCETTFIALWCQNRLWYEILESCTSFSHGICPSHSYQVSVHLAKGFQRRRLKCKKLTDERRLRKYFQPIHCLPFYFWPSKPLYFSLSHCHLLPRAIFREDLLQMLPTKFQFIWLRVFRGED
jgi:hypothetical protein